MNLEAPFASIQNDTGIVAEILHVSPMFVRFGPPRRGQFAERRLARTRRTDARHARRQAATAEVELTVSDRFRVRS